MSRITLEHQLESGYHRGLATPEWLQAMAAMLEVQTDLEGRGLVCWQDHPDLLMLRAPTPQFTGELPPNAFENVDYFEVTFADRRPAGSPLWSGLWVRVEYQPVEQDFRVRFKVWRLRWRWEVLERLLEGREPVPELLGDLLVGQAGVPRYLSAAPDPGAGELVSRSLAFRRKLAPLGRRGPRLELALADPGELVNLEELGPLELTLATPAQIQDLHDLLYGPRRWAERVRVELGDQLPGTELPELEVLQVLLKPTRPSKMVDLGPHADLLGVVPGGQVLQLHVNNFIHRGRASSLRSDRFAGLFSDAQVKSLDVVVRVQRLGDQVQVISRLHSGPPYQLGPRRVRPLPRGEWLEFWSAAQAIWTDYTSPSDFVDWWTLESWSDAGHSLCCQQSPGYAPLFELKTIGPRADQCPPFLAFCVRFLGLAFRVGEERKVIWE